MTRTIPKLFFGFQAVIDCTPLAYFKNQFALFEDDGKKSLINGWDVVTDFDEHNILLAELAKVMTKGMTVNVLCAAF